LERHRVLRAELVELHPLSQHRVQGEPRRNVGEHGAGGRGGAGLCELPAHQLLHFRDDEHRDGLALCDAAHAVRPLREVAEDHVLAERERGASVERVLDVHPRRVDLIVEGEAVLDGDAALREF